MHLFTNDTLKGTRSFVNKDDPFIHKSHRPMQEFEDRGRCERVYEGLCLDPTGL